MSFLRRLFGLERAPEQQAPAPKKFEFGTQAAAEGYEFGRMYDTLHDGFHPAASTPDQISVERTLQRYRFIVRTAPPDEMEEAYVAAFTAIPGEQRVRLPGELAQMLPEEERASIYLNQHDPQTLARIAIAAEQHHAGSIERVLRAVDGGLRGLASSTLLNTFATAFVDSRTAQRFFDNLERDPDFADQDWTTGTKESPHSKYTRDYSI